MSQDVRKKIALNVKKFRAHKKLTREELSLALGFDNSYISKLEKLRINITIDRLQKIADYFSAEVKDFLA